MLDGGGQARKVEFLLGFSPNATSIVLLELVERRLVAPQDAPPLAHSPIAVFEGPLQTVFHVDVSKERLSTGHAGAETGVIEYVADGSGTD
jgi:hypothetical protein